MNLLKIKKPIIKRLKSIFVFKIKYNSVKQLKIQIKSSEINYNKQYKMKMNKKLYKNKYISNKFKILKIQCKVMN